MSKYIIGPSGSTFEDAEFIVIEADNDGSAWEKYKDWFVLNDNWFLTDCVYTMSIDGFFGNFIYGGYLIDYFVSDEVELDREVEKYEMLTNEEIICKVRNYFENKEWANLYGRFLIDLEYLNKPIEEIKSKYVFPKELLFFIFDIIYEEGWVGVSQFLVDDFLIS